MNETIIGQLNKSLYEEARIFWQSGKGWTSLLWQKLYRLGWRSSRTPAGFRIITEPDGNKINTGHLSRAYMLAFVGKLLR